MTELNFVKEGQGPTIVLSHALGCDLGMWDEVAARLSRRYTVLRYDCRGHGRSPVVPGPCTIADLAEDAAQLIASQAGVVHFVGISMGGMVAQQIAATHPELVRSIVVASSAARYDETVRGMWRSRIETALNLGMEPIADGAMQRWFTRAFRESEAGATRVAQLRSVVASTDPKGYVACCEAVAAIDFTASNSRVACPALVIAGTQDETATPAMCAAIRDGISGAEFATIDAAHLTAVEKPQEFADLVEGFIERL